MSVILILAYEQHTMCPLLMDKLDMMAGMDFEPELTSIYFIHQGNLNYRHWIPNVPAADTNAKCVLASLFEGTRRSTIVEGETVY